MSRLVFAFLGFAIFLSCSEDVKPIDRLTAEDLMAMSSSSGGEASSSSWDEIFSYSSGEEQGARLIKEKISGLSQKGPFVKGSAIMLAELDGSLAQTGNIFQSTVADDKGSFEISGIALASPYVRLRADGYYYNEVSGKKSISTITLYAIADLTDRSSLNVNLLTHLEHERVLKLAEGGRSVPEAKKQAQREILDVFGISGEFASSEDMSVFGRDDNSAALLAVSVLMQGDREEAAFTDLLADFNQSVKNFGTWSDAKKVLVADWASGADLDKIRSNIAGWGFSSEIPDFERHIRRYWAEVYGLGGCGSANSGAVRGNVNSLSVKKGNSYVCEGGYWELHVVGEPSSSSEEVLSSSSEHGSSGAMYSSSSVETDNNPSSSSVSSSSVSSSSSAEPSSSGAVSSSSGEALCNGKTYTDAEFCYDNKDVRLKCGGKTYNENQFCVENSVYTLCGGSQYDPTEEFCLGGTKTSLCGGKFTYTSSEFCAGDGKVRNRCGGKTFSISTQKCDNNIVMTKCGNDWYNEETKFCSGSTVYGKCGGSMEYTPEIEECCGNGKYTLATQFCHSDNKVYDKCGGKDYDPTTHYCHTDGETYTCGNKPYNPSTHFCYDDSKIGKYCGERTDAYNPDLYKCKPNINSNGIYLKTPVSYGDKSYEAVLIGEQVWMAENLNYAVEDSKCYGEGGEVLIGRDEDYNLITKTLSHAEVQANCAEYGRLYNWVTAMGLPSCNSSSSCTSQIQSPHRGICPSGWHIPSNEEFDKFVNYVGNMSMSSLKATSGWNSCGLDYPYSCNDTYGFSALPGGKYSYSPATGYSYIFNSVGDGGEWWSAEEYGGNIRNAVSRFMTFNNNGSGFTSSSKLSSLYSVRCLQD